MLRNVLESYNFILIPIEIAYEKQLDTNSQAGQDGTCGLEILVDIELGNSAQESDFYGLSQLSVPKISSELISSKKHGTVSIHN